MDDQFITIVKTLIENKLSSINSISDVAKILQISTETLRKKFYREERKRLSNYIVNCKIIAMKEMLIASKAPCFEICYTVGLREDTGAKLFKKHTGLTMRQFRDLYRKDFCRKNSATNVSKLEGSSNRRTGSESQFHLRHTLTRDSHNLAQHNIHQRKTKHLSDFGGKQQPYLRSSDDIL